MSIFLFFGFTIAVIIFGLVFSGLVIRHHWKKNGAISKKTSSDTTAPSAH